MENMKGNLPGSHLLNLNLLNGGKLLVLLWFYVDLVMYVLLLSAYCKHKYAIQNYIYDIFTVFFFPKKYTFGYVLMILHRFVKIVVLNEVKSYQISILVMLMLF